MEINLDLPTLCLGEGWVHKELMSVEDQGQKGV